MTHVVEERPAQHLQSGLARLATLGNETISNNPKEIIVLQLQSSDDQWGGHFLAIKNQSVRSFILIWVPYLPGNAQSMLCSAYGQRS